LTLFAGFSPENTPHLRPAFELDSALIEFSELLLAKGLPTVIDSEGALDRIMGGVAEHIKTLNLWQYYVLDGTAEKAAIKAAVASGKTTPWVGTDVKGKTAVELAQILRDEGRVIGLGSLSKRFGTTVDAGVAAGLINAAFVNLGDSPDATAEAWGQVVDVLNVPLYQEWEEDTRIALDGVKNRMKYTRLDEHGPKLGEISKT
jgi:glycogen debranching enzyme